MEANRKLLRPPHPGAASGLAQAARLAPDKVLNPDALSLYGGIWSDRPVLVTLTAGMGKRFGAAPKCAQPVHGIAVARYSIDAFRRFSPGPVISVVGYRRDEVMRALGDDNIYVETANPTGGTAFAAYEAFSVRQLQQRNPVVFISMGDRVVTPNVFVRLFMAHIADGRESDLTLLTALYQPPRNKGKGRIVRDAAGRVVRIMEQRDIDDLPADERQRLDALAEGNCPLYAIRANTLRQYLADLDNRNSQGQYYITDLVARIAADGGEVRAVTVTSADPDYDLLVADVTRPGDLETIEGILASAPAFAQTMALARAAQEIAADRPAGQVAAIAAQLEELNSAIKSEALEVRHDRPVGIGVCGGRLRIAFMHPDMGRFFGPAWQMPIGAASAAGREQIVAILQPTDDGSIHVYPINPEFRERVNCIADSGCMYPGEQVDDWYGYEGFGTRMAEELLASLGYYTDAQLDAMRERGEEMPPPARWAKTNMRRPFSLVGNAIASLRTVRNGEFGKRIEAALGREAFRGMLLVTSGAIPRGGFASSSAVTLAVQNALNAVFSLGLTPDALVDLACQAEYGTGVRAGSLDQATEQKGRPGAGTLISSNPKERYRIIGTFEVPSDRFRVLFPYTVDRDNRAWQWSAGMYAQRPAPGKLTTGEFRKMTGKAAELAAILLRLPLRVDFFQLVGPDMVNDGLLSLSNRLEVYRWLRALPMVVPLDELRQRIDGERRWYADQLVQETGWDLETALGKVEAIFGSLFAEWHEPALQRTTAEGPVVTERGVPLRAMVAYLFGEVAKNLYLINHPEEWIDCVSRSQRGDRCFEIPFADLPSAEEMLQEQPWEEGLTGPALMEAWLERFGAKPFDHNRDLDDPSLDAAIARLTDAIHHDGEDPRETQLRFWRGTNFFRGLALIDLVEAMLKRAFGDDAVAVRVNAAGQGDFFQVHVDVRKAAPGSVMGFIREAVYQRFGLTPEREFVEIHSGGGAAGVRLERLDQLPELIAMIRRWNGKT